MHCLLIHGAGGGGWEWNVWQRVFQARGLRAEAPDLVPAAAGIAATGFDDYLQQVLAHAAALPSPRVLVGASLGGLLALAAATDVGAQALVLVNPLVPAPLHARLPPRAWPEVVPWGRQRSLEGTRRAMPDADDAACLYAFRRWRDESGAVMQAAAAGIDADRPRCPVLVLVSGRDRDVPPELTRALAARLGADVFAAEHESHVGALLGRNASVRATQAIEWVDGAFP